MAAEFKSEVALIKRSIAFRAKYRAEQGPTQTIKTCNPALVAPHPKNRGGDFVKRLRTLEIAGTIVSDGCDPIEANGNAVAVEATKWCSAGGHEGRASSVAEYAGKLRDPGKRRPRQAWRNGSTVSTRCPGAWPAAISIVCIETYWLARRGVSASTVVEKSANEKASRCWMKAATTASSD